MAASDGAGSVRKVCMAECADTLSSETHRYYLSRRTVLEMLRDRGYDVPASELSSSLAEFSAFFGDQPDVKHLRLCVSHRCNPSRKMLVIFLGTEDVNLQTIRTTFAEITDRQNLHGLMLILQSKMNHFANKEVERFPCKVEVFHITDLLVNITSHYLTPKFEILTAEEKSIILKKYVVEDKQLPRMLETDAIARYYGLEKGQVVKVKYSGGIADSLETYRCVM